MFTRPTDLPDSLLADLVRSAWAIEVEDVEYLPVGFGSHHWVATAGDRRWFVTVDASGTGSPALGTAGVAPQLRAALSTASLLREMGLHFVVAPIATSLGEILAPIDSRYAVAVYPFIDGEVHGWGPYPDPDFRQKVFDRIVALHTAPTEARRHILTDRFEIPSRHTVEALGVEVPPDETTPWDAGPFAEPTRQLLARNSRWIEGRFASYDSLVTSDAARSDRFVITHGEPHVANTITSSSEVMLVDWDTALLAPPERDLWWFAGEAPGLVAEYEEQTGTPIIREALELYRLRWDLTDLALFAAQLRHPHDDNKDTRTAWKALTKILAAGRL